MRSMNHPYGGFTGLEAAIVLIAFVVVAASFSYIVLGAGFFATQKAQKTVQTGVAQSSSTLVLVGNVYAVWPPYLADPGTVQWINFSVELGPGGTPVDFDKVTLTYSNTSIQETLQEGPWEDSTSDIDPGQWTVVAVDNEIGAPNHLLEQGEQFEITAYPTNGIYPNDVVNIEIKPATGAAFTITRTLPAALNQVNLLY
jgi:flagellin FlaB